MTGNPLDDITDTLKDAAYVSVGLGLLVFQRLQVRRQELAKLVEERVSSVRGH